MLSPNPWLAIASASPLQSTAPAGILSRPPPTPDPPDPNHFPPLSAARSPSKRSKSHIPLLSFWIFHQKLTTSASPSEISPTVPLPQSTTVLPSSSTSQLLASFIHSPFSNCSQNLSHVPIITSVNHSLQLTLLPFHKRPVFLASDPLPPPLHPELLL
ncbi:hypothetical protein DY000_02049467 [Brassica cretica]|uniref:Uncharacterized protein n=1 Tax=Brassica cretica TaxID=69181 RepID=A0ABQ7EP61_BRACR|nr:hypothetical protein DY000_02049467 [Brassica cretica]